MPNDAGDLQGIVDRIHEIKVVLGDDAREGAVMRVIVKHVGWGTWRWKVTDWHGTVASGLCVHALGSTP